MDFIAYQIAKDPLIVVFVLAAFASALLLLVAYLVRRLDSALHRVRQHRVSQDRGGSQRVAAWLAERHPAAFRWLLAQVHPLAYLVLSVSFGLLVFVTAIEVFSEVLEDLRRQEDLVRFDFMLAEAFRDSELSRTTRRLFLLLTRLGDVSMIALLGLVFAGLLLVQRRAMLCAAWILTLLGGGLLNLMLKALIRRDRPELAEAVVDASGWAFPSGHAMGATIAYGMLAFLILRLFGRSPYVWNLTVVWLATTLALLVGTSRIVLGVHYFSDFSSATSWPATQQVLAG